MIQYLAIVYRGWFLVSGGMYEYVWCTFCGFSLGLSLNNLKHGWLSLYTIFLYDLYSLFSKRTLEVFDLLVSPLWIVYNAPVYYKLQ